MSHVKGSVEGEQDFNLCPFLPEGAPPVQLSCRIARHNKLLQVEFRLRGTLSAIIIPARAAQPQRRHNLWKETCFELFFASAETGPYHEINLSPSGHWNFYSFDEYRQGMRDETIDCLQIFLEPAGEILAARMQIDLGPLGLGDRELLVRPCAMLLAKARTYSCWALTHPGLRPDFHDRRTDFCRI